MNVPQMFNTAHGTSSVPGPMRRSGLWELESTVSLARTEAKIDQFAECLKTANVVERVRRESREPTGRQAATSPCAVARTRMPMRLPSRS
jgi:hypothetical protein